MKLMVMAMQQRPDTPFTLSDLAEATGSSIFSIQKLAQKLVKRGVFYRGKDGQSSTFLLVNAEMKAVR